MLYSQGGLNEAAEDLRIFARGRDGDGPAEPSFSVRRKISILDCGGIATWS